MRTPLLPLSCAGLALLLVAAPAAAQEAAPTTQLFTVHEDVVKPSKVAQYEAAAKSLTALFTKHGIVDVGYNAASGDDFTYLYISPVANMAAIDQASSKWTEARKKIGEATFDAAMKQYDGTYDSHRNYMVRMHPELSYNPEYGQDPVASGMAWRHWDFLYIMPDKGEEATAILKDWKTTSAAKKIAGGYRIYMGDMGTEQPMIIVAWSAKNAAEFYAQDQARRTAMGAEGEALKTRMLAVLSRYETSNGMMRPDLSYTPAAATATRK